MRIVNILKDTNHRIIIILSSILFLAPQLLWPRKLVGGDDSHLYYYYPTEYLRNFTPTLIGDNVLGVIGGYFPQSYATPFIGVLALIKNMLPNINIQYSFYGLNLMGSFLAFYALSKFLVPKMKSWIKISASLVYALSIFSFYTIWMHQLFSLYLATVIPALLALYIKGIRSNTYVYPVIISLIISLFSIFFVSLPWLLGMVFASISLLVLEKKPRIQIKHIGIIVTLSLIMNAYWITHIVLGVFESRAGHQGNLVSQTSQDSTRQSNSEMINILSSQNQILYPLNNLFHYKLQKNNNWKSTAIFESLHLKLLPLNTLVLLLVLYAGVKSRSSKDFLNKRYASSLLSYIIITFLFTANIGGWGQAVFSALNTYIPGFVMFRNMFDKFGPAMALSWSIVILYSLAIVCRSASKHLSRAVFAGIVLLTFISAGPFLLGAYYKQTFATTKSIYPTITEFNPSFMELMGYVSSLESGRVLWLPLNSANYLVISDAHLHNHYYIGTSPFRYLANTSDLTGLLSFPEGYADILLNSLSSADSHELKGLLATLNITHIIINNDIHEELLDTYLFSQNKPHDLFDKQDLSVIDKVSDFEAEFGGKYSLHKVHDDKSNPKLYIETSDNERKTIEVTQTGQYSYVFSTDLSKDDVIHFNDTYHRLWLLTPKNCSDNLSPAFSVPYEQHNTWQIHKDINCQFKIEFVPSTYQNLLNYLSLAGMLIASLYVIVNVKKLQDE